MSLKFFLFVFSALFFFSLRSVAQNYNCSVEGRVVSQSTGQPLEYVNVYISGTKWGTTTNKAGYYKIKSLPYGNLTVVASMVGFKPQVATITLKEEQTVEVNFKLEEKSYEINQVVVSGKTPKDWKDNFDEFKKYFLGEGPNTDECKILNPEVINFTKTESGYLTATATQPIIVLNNSLGYKINIELVSFDWDKEKQTLKYVLESYFTELKDTTGELKKGWMKNREDTYYGSMTDFIKSLIYKTFMEEGFRVYYNKKLPFKFNSLYKTYFKLDKVVINKINSNYYELNFDRYLRIEYDSDVYHKTEISWLKLNFPNVLLDRFGYPVVALAFSIYGDWSYSGVSNLLPKYYKPEKEK